MMLARTLPDPAPDAREYVEILLGRRHANRIPLVEYAVDDVVLRPVVVNLLGRPWVERDSSRDRAAGYFDNFLAFWYRMGYDVVRFEASLPLPQRQTFTPDTAPGVARDRGWADEHHGMIASWEDYERYPWPRLEEFDFFPFEYLNAHLPEGMGLVSSHGGGVFEQLSWVMSLEGLCMALHEDPALVKGVADRLGELMVGFYRHLLDLENLVALFPGDDMGYRNATLVSPEDLRRIVLPWHRKFARMAHDRGVPYFLHSCGRITAIMEDLINDVQIDGKHSFEDAIVPVEEFQALYGDRIAALGGVDLNILSGGSPGDVRRRVRELVLTCGPRGRFALGSGNSIPSYVPVENYLAMVEEAKSFSP